MNKNLIFIGAGSLVAAYFAGRYSAPEKVKIETVTVTKEVVIQDESKKLRQTERIIETVTKDGRPLKKTIIQTREASERSTTSTRDAAVREKKEIENRRGVIASILVGMPLTEIARGPVYGASLSRQMFGPFSLGVWAFTDLRVGFSIGVEL